MFHFEYDQWYLSRSGDHVRISIAIGEMVYGSNGYWYLNDTENGGRLYDDQESRWDLVEFLPFGKPRINGPYQIGEAYARKHPNVMNIVDNPYEKHSKDYENWKMGFFSGIATAGSRP